MDDSKKKILNKYRDSIVQDLVVEYIIEELLYKSVLTKDEADKINRKVGFYWI